MRYPPMLAVASDVEDVVEGFAYEFKWDGVRTVIEVGAHGGLTMWSRNGTDVSARYPELHGLADACPDPAVIDGEVIALDERGQPSFGALQPRMHLTDPARVRAAAARRPVSLVLFDLLELRGEPLIGDAYEARRQGLAGLGLAGQRWQTPPHHHGDPRLLLRTATEHGLEGIVAKRPGSVYRPGRRSDDWRKVRLVRRQEFVVGGYAPGEGRRHRLGSLLLGYHDGERGLRYAGAVGSGLTERQVEQLRAFLDACRRDRSPFADPVPRADAVFCEPALVVEVAFTEWTHQGVLRAPVFQGVRSDKPAVEVVYPRGSAEGPPA